MVLYAFGDSYSLSESLVKTTPILLCALAVILPARLGLVTVGAEGQLYFGALTGTAIVCPSPARPLLVLLPAMLAAGAIGGALWSARPGCCARRCNVNETISTLLMNYVAVLLVNAWSTAPGRTRAVSAGRPPSRFRRRRPCRA